VVDKAGDATNKSMDNMEDGIKGKKKDESSKNKNDITCHAELEAIRLAVKKLKTNDLSDCILYSTHEPCIMCSYAIRFHKIKKVVYQHAVNYLGGVSSSMPLLISKEAPPHWGEVPVIVHLNSHL